MQRGTGRIGSGGIRAQWIHKGRLQTNWPHYTAVVLDLAFRPDRQSADPVYRQLEGYLRGLIETQRLAAETKLPASRELAALAYVEEATRQRRVGDATFAVLRRHFEDTHIAEITWLCALENYFNLINVPLEIESDGLCAIAERRRAA